MTTEVVAGEGAGQGRPSFRHLFIDCDDERLQRRYTEQTSGQHPAGMLSDLPLRDRADPVTDPSNPITTELQRVSVGRFGAEERGVGIFITSYSYLPGMPRDATIVFDALVSRQPPPGLGAAIAHKAVPRGGRAYRPAPASWAHRGRSSRGI